MTVKAVYIRQTGSHKKQKTIDAMKNLESMGVDTCYFKESNEAIAHSKRVGIISEVQ